MTDALNVAFLGQTAKRPLDGARFDTKPAEVSSRKDRSWPRLEDFPPDLFCGCAFNHSFSPNQYINQTYCPIYLFFKQGCDPWRLSPSIIDQPLRQLRTTGNQHLLRLRCPCIGQ
jgi:hypothetical protein